MAHGATNRDLQGWHQGRARGLQLHERKHLSPCRRKFEVLSEEIWQNDVTYKVAFFSHFGLAVGSSSPSIRRVLVPPLLVICHSSKESREECSKGDIRCVNPEHLTRLKISYVSCGFHIDH